MDEYNFIIRRPDTSNADWHAPESGSLQDAIDYAHANLCSVQLTDEPGFTRGYVYCDGTYNLL